MPITIFLIFVISVLLGFIIFILFLKNKNSQDIGTRLLQEQIIEINKKLDDKLSQINRNSIEQAKINQDLSKFSSDKIEELSKKLSSLEETNKQIKDIGKGLEGLENILKNPKHRGILGEYFLENLLKNILAPQNYTMQYKFKNGQIVDAVIFVQEKLIPIDSKFSLENYNKAIEEKQEEKKDIFIKNFSSDLKKRIDETSKYIQKQENTMDFAFMFIPSESIYYDLLVNKIGNTKANTLDLIEYAFKQKKVIIVSPTSFYAYLQTVLQGLKALEIEEKAQEIKKSIIDISKHLKTYEQYFLKLGNSLGVSVSHYNEAEKNFLFLNRDISKISGEKFKTDLLNLEKPEKKYL